MRKRTIQELETELNQNTPRFQNILSKNECAVLLKDLNKYFQSKTDTNSAVFKNGSSLLSYESCKTFTVKSADEYNKKIKKASTLYTLINDHLIDRVIECMIDSLPSPVSKRNFALSYGDKGPQGIFITKYLHNTNECKIPTHLDSVNFGSVIIELTSHEDAGLITYTRDQRPRSEKLQAGEAIVILKGIPHSVNWSNKPEDRIVIVFNF